MEDLFADHFTLAVSLNLEAFSQQMEVRKTPLPLKASTAHPIREEELEALRAHRKEEQEAATMESESAVAAALGTWTGDVLFFLENRTRLTTAPGSQVLFRAIDFNHPDVADFDESGTDR